MRGRHGWGYNHAHEQDVTGGEGEGLSTRPELIAEEAGYDNTMNLAI